MSPKLVGRYALFEEIACGGMAAVHVGRLVGPVGFSRTVAIKRLHPQYAKDPEFVTMFLDEARLAARVRHPNVVPTLDVVAEQGEIFLVMEYVQGESFAKLLRLAKSGGTRAPRAIVCAVLASVLHGLHAAHEATSERGEPLGIVHRDVSPQNILVGVDGIARVLDFGIAKAAGRAQITREGQIRGKMAYIAPEQFRNSPADRKADIYAAAVVLWEALTGERLFLGDCESATVAKVLTGEVAPPSSIVPETPPELDAVVMRGLDRDRIVRFDTAREMARALETCGPLATATQLGEWVEATAGTELAHRARIISEVEQIEAHRAVEHSVLPWRFLPSSDEPTAVDLGTLAGDPREGLATRNLQSDWRWRVTLVVVMGLLAGTAGFWLALAAKQEHRTAEERSLAASPVYAAEGKPPPPERATPAALASASPPAPSGLGTPTQAPTPSAEPTSQPKLAPIPRIAPKPPEKTNCEPPYTIDEVGHRHYKLECL
ncbi:MAG: serine/threonine protein kinase [Polyangiaceae bacterium]|nr:serine/threonine protein kinase [Polyangiaceae bacterium]